MQHTPQPSTSGTPGAKRKSPAPPSPAAAPGPAPANVPRPYTVGERVDACDAQGRWWLSTVAEVTGTRVRVRFDRWEPRYPLWIDAAAPPARLAPPNTKSNPALLPAAGGSAAPRAPAVPPPVAPAGPKPAIAAAPTVACPGCEHRFDAVEGRPHTPATLPCGHSLCSACANGARAVCPVCSKSFPSPCDGRAAVFPPNFALLAVLAPASATQAPAPPAPATNAPAALPDGVARCDGCRNSPAMVYCGTCRDLTPLCASCFDSAHHAPWMRAHAKCALHERQFESEKCPAHPTERVSHICVTDQTPLCGACDQPAAVAGATGDAAAPKRPHAEHTVLPLSHVVATRRKRLETLSAELESARTRSGTGVPLKPQCTAADLCAQLDAAHAALAHALSAHIAQLKAEVHADADRHSAARDVERQRATAAADATARATALVRALQSRSDLLLVRHPHAFADACRAALDAAALVPSASFPAAPSPAQELLLHHRPPPYDAVLRARDAEQAIASLIALQRASV